MKKCIVCNKEFVPKNSKGVFCSVSCRQKDHRKKVAIKLKSFEELKARFNDLEKAPVKQDIIKAPIPKDFIEIKGVVESGESKWKIKNPIPKPPDGLTKLQKDMWIFNWKKENVK